MGFKVSREFLESSRIPLLKYPAEFGRNQAPLSSPISPDQRVPGTDYGSQSSLGDLPEVLPKSSAEAVLLVIWFSSCRQPDHNIGTKRGATIGPEIVQKRRVQDIESMMYLVLKTSNLKSRHWTAW